METIKGIDELLGTISSVPQCWPVPLFNKASGDSNGQLLMSISLEP